MTAPATSTMFEKPPTFPPVDDAVTLYPGKVMHARLKPFGHRFNYRVFSILIDLDRLHDAAQSAALFSVNRVNVAAFYERDHLPERGDTPLRTHINDLLSEAGTDAPARALLLAYPRLFGFAFNPISVYFCYDENDRLTAAIYEVRNTFGERHTYVCAVEPGELTKAGLRQERTKIFYVSPFIDMGARYHFRVTPPGDQVKLRIFETEDDAPLLAATFIGDAKPVTNTSLFLQVARLPFMTFKIVAGIHWEALKLWIKGAKFFSRGAPPEPVSYTDRQLPAE
ncbi:MAG: DUF1365 domain-containing protein [Ahrensia sp.]